MTQNVTEHTILHQQVHEIVIYGITTNDDTRKYTRVEDEDENGMDTQRESIVDVDIESSMEEGMNKLDSHHGVVIIPTCRKDTHRNSTPQNDLRSVLQRQVHLGVVALDLRKNLLFLYILLHLNTLA